MRLREAAASDGRAIAEVHVASWRETYAGLLPDSFIARQGVDGRETQWKRTLERDPRLSDVFVAEHGGAAAGFVASGACRDAGLAHEGEIYALYLLRAHQRRGIGRALCRAAALRMRERGLRSAAVWVLSTNQPARRFYEALGGVPIAERSERQGDATLVEIAYGWDDLDSLVGSSTAIPGLDPGIPTGSPDQVRR
jgi:ribosomal protein S18 acetylase RimI-like enzyme